MGSFKATVFFVALKLPIPPRLCASSRGLRIVDGEGHGVGEPRRSQGNGDQAIEP